MTYFYVKIENEWILIKKQKIKISKFDNVINLHKIEYEYMFDDVHIEISFGSHSEDLSYYYFLLTYDDMNVLLNITHNKIPYHKHRIQDGICLSTTNKYKTELLTLCKTCFAKYNVFVV
jgi:hypothetical protein